MTFSSVEIGARAVLAVTSVLYLAFGGYCLLRPEAVRDGLGLVPADAAARVELMAVYGGLELGLGLFFGLCAVVSGWQVPGLAASVLTFGLLVAVRFTAGAVYHTLHGPTVALLLMECVLGASAAVVLIWHRVVVSGGGM